MGEGQKFQRQAHSSLSHIIEKQERFQKPLETSCKTPLKLLAFTHKLDFNFKLLFSPNFSAKIAVSLHCMTQTILNNSTFRGSAGIFEEAIRFPTKCLLSQNHLGAAGEPEN